MPESLKHSYFRPATAGLRRLWVVLPLLGLTWTIIFIAHYQNAWLLPEANVWNSSVLTLHPSESVKAIFNWRLFEYQPRVTRPLSSAFEILDTHFRAYAWNWMVPHPAVSLTYFFTLLLSPLLLYRLLRTLRISFPLSCCGVALYFCNPGIMSLVSMYFRPGKAMACFSLILLLYIAARLNISRSYKYLTVLYVIVFLSFFWDETALVSFPALLILFPGLVFSSWWSSALFLSLPGAYAAVVFCVLPWLHRWAGFPVPAGQTYPPLRAALQLLGFSGEPQLYAELARNLLRNSRIALMDCLGLIDPALARATSYYLLFGAIVICLLGFVGLGVFRVIRKYNSGPDASPHGSMLLRSVVFLATCLLFHSVLLGVVNVKVWGLYWYGVFAAIGFILLVCLFLQHFNVPAWTAAVFVMLVMTATHYVFGATNHAYKQFHYYPYRPAMLSTVFENRLNRFAYRRPENRSDLYETTRKVWLAARSGIPLTGVPSELLYLVYELKIGAGPVWCDMNSRTFSVVGQPSHRVAVCAAGWPDPGNESISRVIGSWCGGKCTIEKHHAERLMVVNEKGMTSPAKRDGMEIHVFTWNLFGVLSEDEQRIAWADGTVCQKHGHSTNGRDLAGEWRFHDQCAFWSSSYDLLLTNQEGGTSPATIWNERTIIAPDWNLSGEISEDGAQVLWANGTVWRRGAGPNVGMP